MKTIKSKAQGFVMRDDIAGKAKVHPLPPDGLLMSSTERARKRSIGCLDNQERDALFHALDLAMRVLEDDVKIWTDAKPNALVCENAIPRMKEQFEFYVRRLVLLREKLENADQIHLLPEELEL